MTNISIDEIVKRKNSKIPESVLWSILSLGIENIQNPDFLKESEMILVTPNHTFISISGQLIFTANDQYDELYCPPEYPNSFVDWPELSTDQRREIGLYSLGKTLMFCVKYKNGESLPISKEFDSIINQMSDRNVDNRMTLSKSQQICNMIAKKYTQGQSFNDHIATLYRMSSVRPRMMRSLSSSNMVAKIAVKNSDRQSSLEPSNKTFYVEDRKNSNHTQFSTTGSSSTSENNFNSSSTSTPRSGNVYLSRMDNSCKPNIPAVMERAKAQSKLSKNHGPVKSPAVQTNGTYNSQNMGRGYDIIQTDSQCNNAELSHTPFTEMANVERLDGIRRMLGPEFIIRQNEIFNVACNLQRKNSIFNRSDSARGLQHSVEVHLLNGVKLIVRNLNKQSILSHVINAVHGAFPDLEFVNYGLCFMLDDEFCFLKEETNIHKLAEYLTQKLSSTKSLNDTEKKKELHLYYRMKFYPTEEIISEMNNFNRKLFYLQLRQDLLYNNNPPTRLQESLEFAGMAVQAEFGYNVNNLQENPDYLKIEYYFHSLFRPFLEINNDEASFLKFHQEDWMDQHWESCEHFFIDKICKNKYYGMHWYRVNKNHLGIIDAIGKNTYLVIGRETIQLLDVSRSHSEMQIHKHFSYKWRQIESISLKHKKLLIKPKMQLKVEGLNTANAFVCFLDRKTKAEHIVRLCNEHHLLASQKDETDNRVGLSQNQFGSHHRLSAIDYPVTLTRRSQAYEYCEDEIFTNDFSNDEELCHSSRMYDDRSVSSNHKKFYVGSLNNLNQQRARRISSSNYGSTQNIFVEEPIPNSRRPLKETQTRQVQNNKSSRSLLQVNITRRKSTNESLGVGIIKIQNQSYEGIFIKRIMRGSPVDKCGSIEIGDEIIDINDQPVSNLTQSEVGAMMKDCGESISFTIKKHDLMNGQNGKSKVIKKSISFSQNDKEMIEAKSSEMNGKKNKFNIVNKSAMQMILMSNSAFNIFKPNHLCRNFPNLKFSNESNNNLFSKIDLEDSVSKEIRKIKAKQLLGHNIAHNSQVKKHTAQTNGYSPYIPKSDTSFKTCDVKIQIQKLLAVNMNSQISDLPFTLLKLDKTWNQLCWKSLIENNSKLIVCLDVNQKHKFSSKNFLSNGIQKSLENDEYSVIVEETYEYSKSIIFYRLSISAYHENSSQETTHRMFLVSFNDWTEKMERENRNESILQAINISCGINENLPCSGPVVVCGQQLNSAMGMFITLYSLILLGTHRKLSISPIIRYQTIIYAICSQISSQIIEVVPNESQYKKCVSFVNQLTSYSDYDNSTSENSDIN